MNRLNLWIEVVLLMGVKFNENYPVIVKRGVAHVLLYQEESYGKVDQYS